ncbi:hypothetical protein [Botrimarina hoheduenensis]|uniref:Prenyltransferase and squalene oxidase repeat protein n=1 Tax=Botrimarina hoheduenensis TaxID=2528000 RepID=A0A5C5WAS6_9BACT|nr:hypothetical protein [Botrimarina hoheduenensis]TWT47179.1 Prenyltransferase and squalene oxidase repeat protein [Botrimarina hoheduenensis]
MLLAVVLANGVVALAGVALLACLVVFAATFTRWGRRRVMARYAAASVAAHLLLLLLAASVRQGNPAPGAEAAPTVRVQIVMRKPSDSSPAKQASETTPSAEANEPRAESAADELAQHAATAPAAEADTALADASIEVPPAPEPEPVAPSVAAKPESGAATQPMAAADSEPVPLVEPSESLAAEPLAESTMLLESLLTNQPTSLNDPPSVVTPLDMSTQVTQDVAPAGSTVPSTAKDPASAANQAAWQSTYTTRGALQRRRLAERDGGDAQTEDAVARGVDWLARAQRADGGWDTVRWGAGREDRVLGEDRGSAGKQAQTGLTGLALLAMQGAGHTHLDGPYSATITAGLAYLIDQQQVGGDRDGDLSGDATLYARTYCHSMATFALAEAYATTGDERLGSAVRRATGFLERTQNATYGGWRYVPGDRGDMSQMGWAVMALRSAELAGVPIRPSVWDGIEQFLASVAMGRSRGLACYRPGGGPTPTMTAEALYCRQILGRARTQPAAGREAIGLLAQNLPESGGRRPPNLYYWYYGTLALHHERNTSSDAQAAWSAWNAGMKQELVPRQVVDGPNLGSWRPDTLWGGYGGRVYTTALATMCLEVYYRYDPDEIGRDPWLASRGAQPSAPTGGTRLWR